MKRTRRTPALKGKRTAANMSLFKEYVGVMEANLRTHHPKEQSEDAAPTKPASKSAVYEGSARIQAAKELVDDLRDRAEQYKVYENFFGLASLVALETILIYITFSAFQGNVIVIHIEAGSRLTMLLEASPIAFPILFYSQFMKWQKNGLAMKTGARRLQFAIDQYEASHSQQDLESISTVLDDLMNSYHADFTFFNIRKGK